MVRLEEVGRSPRSVTKPVQLVQMVAEVGMSLGERPEVGGKASLQGIIQERSHEEDPEGTSQEQWLSMR